MRFGKIEYLNLLPFDVFVKKYPTSSGFKKFLKLKKSYPSKLNSNFLRKYIDAGFISSIAAYFPTRLHRATKAGIIARGAVWSVIAIPQDEGEDYQSASSNALAKVLRIQGRILIGDRALRYKLRGDACQDLGQEWWKKHHLGFTFGRLCYNKYRDFYENLALKFVQSRIKIPYYILLQNALRTEIAPNDIKAYLTHIHYNITKKEEVALQRFYTALRLNHIKKPSRFKFQKNTLR